MSMKLTAQALDMKVGSATRKLVLVCMADIAGKDGTCFPSYQHIADQCEMSKRAVIDHINALEGMGLIQKQRRKNNKRNSSNVYKVTLFSSADIAPPPSAESAPPSEISAPPPSAESAPRTSNSFEPVTEPKDINTKNSKSTPKNVEEVADYCKSRNNGINPQKFFDHYEANGWVRGKTKIKDWKACVRTWEQNETKPVRPTKDFSSKDYSKGTEGFVTNA